MILKDVSDFRNKKQKVHASKCTVSLSLMKYFTSIYIKLKTQTMDPSNQQHLQSDAFWAAYTTPLHHLEFTKNSLTQANNK